MEKGERGLRQALFGSTKTAAMEKLFERIDSREPVALTGLPEDMAAFLAAKIAEVESVERVLVI